MDTNPPELPELGSATVVCLLCGGRGGWWSHPAGSNSRYDADGFREACSRCKGTGWEPSLVIIEFLTSSVD